MTNKKRKAGPSVEEALEKPWCYYCERDFNDQRVLIDHQKAKHFSCRNCPRKLNTPGGLSVHMQQVHKETLTYIDNAIEGREGVEPEIFGMMGVPEQLLEAHKQRVLNEFFKVEAERRALTGNPPPGQKTGEPAVKKTKVETSEGIKARLAEHKAKLAAKKQALAEGNVTPTSSETPAQASAPAPAPVQSPVATQHSPAYGTPTYSNSAYSAPAYPTAHLTHPTQQQAASPPFPYPAPAQGYHPYSMPPQMPPHYASSFSPPTHTPFSAPPPMANNYPPASPMTVSRPPSHNTAYRKPTPPDQSGGLPRQNSLPAASGLPARPTFDPPNFNRQDMQRLHTGQAPPPSGNGTASGYHDAPVVQRPVPVKKTAKELEDEAFDEMLKSTKREFKEGFAASDAAKAAEELAADAAADANATETGTNNDASAVKPYHASMDGAQDDINPAPADVKSGKSATDGKKKKSKPSRSRLVSSNNELSLEELMSTWTRYSFERNGVEWSEGPIGAAVTGVNVDEDTVLDPQD